VTRIDVARRYYEQALGFGLAWTWGDPPTHAGLRRDHVTLDLIVQDADRVGTAMLYVRISGVDDYHASLRARGVSVGALAHRPYGLRDFQIIDPFGNRIAFGEPWQAG
jgi:uncharacterized glyoxalase superfamily protein PhnB